MGREVVGVWASCFQETFVCLGEWSSWGGEQQRGEVGVGDVNCPARLVWHGEGVWLVLCLLSGWYSGIYMKER